MSVRFPWVWLRCFDHYKTIELYSVEYDVWTREVQTQTIDEYNRPQAGTKEIWHVCQVSGWHATPAGEALYEEQQADEKAKKVDKKVEAA